MVVNVQSLWGCEFYNWGRRIYIVQGFNSKDACEKYVDIMCRNIAGTRRIVKGAKV